MREALERCYAAHKAELHALKEQLRSERSARAEEHAAQEARIAALEDTKRTLRDLVRRQSSVLEHYRRLLPEQQPEGDDLPPLAALEAVESVVADAEAHVADPAPPLRKRSDAPHRLVDSQGEWDVVPIGGGGGGGDAIAKGVAGARMPAPVATVEVVRNKKARESLPVVDDCPMCAEFVEVLVTETGQPREQLLRLCQRHRSEHKQPSTPPGYWDVGF